MKQRLSIRYIVELVITLLLILFITVVLVRVFVYSRDRTVYAKNLTEAVRLSESFAELSAGLDDRQQFVEAVKGLENVVSVAEADNRIFAEIALPDSKEGSYLVQIDWQEQQGEDGRFIVRDIGVFCDGGSEEIYSLHTGNYSEE